MQAELPVDGRFDPEAFAYQAHVTGSGPFLRVAHLAALKRDFTFALPAGNLPQGQSEASPLRAGVHAASRPPGRG